jgi:hypothetical protein
MRYAIIALALLCSVTSAAAQVSVGIGLPSVSIGFNVPTYPTLVAVPGYPVYYAPQLNSNYFFYDGMYWVYERDNWYASSWYNGPWSVVGPEAVPAFVLRIPVRYYRQPPIYFRGWRADAPPRWGEHWGGAWEQRRRGWDNWNRRAVPPRAALPVYQRGYAGNRYPRADQQRVIHEQNYRVRAEGQPSQGAGPRARGPNPALPAHQGGQVARQERFPAQQNVAPHAQPVSPQLQQQHMRSPQVRAMPQGNAAAHSTQQREQENRGNGGQRGGDHNNNK